MKAIIFRQLGVKAETCLNIMRYKATTQFFFPGHAVLKDSKSKKHKCILYSWHKGHTNTDLLREGVGAGSHILSWPSLLDASSEDTFSMLVEVHACNSSWIKSVRSEEGLQESSSSRNFPSFFSAVFGSFCLLVVISKLDMSTSA